ncbi:MAG: RsmE family RNA methyltransferase [Candidatus Cloacimonetes bacterium]|nr:RsmE family RNA methyltransferase [Candidatus Cloacimonadota bacterium]
MPSIYSPNLVSGATSITIEGDEFHHLCHVKRIGVGYEVRLNNGEGIIAEGKISAINKHKAEIVLQTQAKFTAPQRPYAIAFALLKNKHDELLIEKCTELGASAFYPLESEFSVKTTSANTIIRFARIALAAIKQCDNPWLPIIKPTLKLKQAIQEIIKDGYTPILCSEARPEASLATIDEAINPCFIIGPEGGFSAQEFAFFADQKISAVSICKLVTRAETAAIAVTAQFAATQIL